MRGRSDNTVRWAVIIGLCGLIVGFFIGEFFVYLSESVEFLGFLSHLGFSMGIGPESFAVNLLFARFSLGFTLNFSIMGVVSMIVCLIIYFRRR